MAPEFPIPSWSAFASSSEALQVLLYHSSFLHEEEEEENEEQTRGASREEEPLPEVSEDDWRKDMADFLAGLGFLDPDTIFWAFEPWQISAALKFAVWQRIYNPGAFLRSVLIGADVGELKPFVARCMRVFLWRFRRHLTHAERRTLQEWLDYPAKRRAEQLSTSEHLAG